MTNNSFMRAEDVAEVLGISKSHAYKIMRKLNAELASKGFLTISGRINKRYFMERAYYFADEERSE